MRTCGCSLTTDKWWLESRGEEGEELGGDGGINRLVNDDDDEEENDDDDDDDDDDEGVDEDAKVVTTSKAPFPNPDVK